MNAIERTNSDKLNTEHVFSLHVGSRHLAAIVKNYITTYMKTAKSEKLKSNH